MNSSNNNDIIMIMVSWIYYFIRFDDIVIIMFAILLGYHNGQRVGDTYVHYVGANILISYNCSIMPVIIR